MKAIYFDFVPEGNIGVRNKIDCQIEALSGLGVHVVHANYDDGYNLGDKKLLNFSARNKLLRKLFEIVVVFRILRCKFSDVDFVYLRHVRLTPWFYLMIRGISKKVDKLYVEIATYPYDGEVSRFSPLSLSDNFFRKKINKFVDTVFCFGKSSGSIWGIPSIEMFNSIDPMKIDFYDKKTYRSDGGVVNFLSVSKLSKWHGYDRFIESVAKSKPDVRERIVFHIVGDGAERFKLEELVEKYGLSSNVKFYGSKSGKELDEIYAISDVGVASLGLYRIGLDEITPLKMSEYAAKGLPFVLANKDPRFEGVDFVCRIANNEREFDLGKVVEWYDRSTFTADSIRGFAEKNLTWKDQMRKVIERFNAQ